MTTTSTSFTDEQLSTDPILNYFEYAHLTEPLRSTSASFAALAAEIVSKVPRCPERTVALRKVLEAKDCAVRAMIPQRQPLSRTAPH